MRAVTLHEHGGIDSLTLDETFPDPVADDGHVLIRVGATSLNYHDVFTCQGMPGIKVPMPMIIGLDIAGDILEVGSGVAGWCSIRRLLNESLPRKHPGIAVPSNAACDRRRWSNDGLTRCHCYERSCCPAGNGRECGTSRTRRETPARAYDELTSKMASGSKALTTNSPASTISEILRSTVRLERT